MYCRNHIQKSYGEKFNCYDRSDGYIKYCYSINVDNNGNYKCYDPTNGKWEWPNWNEHDGTPDDSHLTSVETDGILITSPSIDEIAVRVLKEGEEQLRDRSKISTERDESSIASLNETFLEVMNS